MSSSTNSDSEQYEGGGPQLSPDTVDFEGGRRRSHNEAIDEAKEMLRSLWDDSNPQKGMYDFTDPETGEVREYFMAVIHKDEILDQVHEVIAKLRAHKRRAEGLEPEEADDTYKAAPAGDAQSEFGQQSEFVSEWQEDGEEAGDKYVSWEPRGIFQKIINPFWNMMEAHLPIILGMVAFAHPSMNSLAYFWAYLIMFHPMTMDVRVRFRWGIFYLVILLVVELVWFIFKVRQLRYFVPGVEFADVNQYHKIVNKLLMLGYSFTYDKDVLNKDKRPSMVGPFKTTDMQTFASFDAEIVALVGNLFLICFLGWHQFKVAKLQKTGVKKIERYIRLLDPPEEELDDDEAEEAMNIGVNKKAKDKARKLEIKRQKEEKKAQDKEYLAQLQKEIHSSLIGNERFYKWNQQFFALGLLSKLLESVTFNSLSSLPGLFLVLGLFAMYDLRKKYSKSYRSYSFNVVYFIQYMMIVKLSFDIFMHIPNINAHLVHEKQNDKHYQSTILQVLFGKLNSIEDHETEKMELYTFIQFLAFFINIYCFQGWKTCKWMEIRDKTRELDINAHNSSKRFWQYIKIREAEDKEENALIEILLSNDKQKIKAALLESQRKSQLRKKTHKFDSGNAHKKAKAHNSYLAQMILVTAQVSMFLLAYMYHSSYGLFNLMWVILSFVLSTNNTFFFSIVVMIPIMTWQFIFIYAGHVPKIRETNFFKAYGKYFRFDMKSQIVEQFFMISILLVFYMMISSYMRRLDNPNVENGLIRFFRRRIHGKQLRWIWVFFGLRFTHVIILIYLFQRGVENLDCFNNLGYMVFFVIYTAYEGVYRQTGWVLIFFTSMFILVQYYMSLHYQIYMRKGNEVQINNLYWWNFFPRDYKNDDNLLQDPFHISAGDSLYFRCSPHIEDWLNIFLMKLLREINIIYTTEKQSEYKLRQEAKHVVAEKTGKLGYYFNRVKRIFVGIFNYLVIVGLVLVQGICQPSIITWMFFSLNLINLSYMIKGSRKSRELKIQFLISSIIKFYALVVIIVNVFVLAWSYKIDLPENKGIKQWLQLIGLKANLVEFNELKQLDPTLTNKEIEHMALKARMIAMVIFFLSSIYLCSLFNSKMKEAEDDENFGEADYKKLFEFKLEKKHFDSDSSESEESEGERIGADGMQESIYKKRKYYTQTDLIDFYEGVRFSVAFMTYRNMRFWGHMDIFAKYANILVTSIYVYAAFGLSVNVFNCINLFILVRYFMFVTVKVGARAKVIQNVSGVQSQCDIQMARIVTKKYKKETFYEFLAARKKTWRAMFFVLICGALIAYPTPIIGKIRQMGLTPSQKQQLDEWSLILFYLGIYMEKSNLLMIGMLLLGLAIERVAINWLENRFGCTHFKLQKFTELDQRREAIRYDWDIVNPKYDVERYRHHYFRNDFDELKELMENQTYQKMLKVKQVKEKLLQNLGGELAETVENENKYKKSLYGDYVPFKIAQRIVETVKFSVRLDCHSKLLNLDDQTKKLIDESYFDNNGNLNPFNHKFNLKFDYESVPVLRDFKIEQLRQVLKEAVDRKYIISWYKGLQLWFETCIVFLLMISLMMKANLWSLIYMIFIFKFSLSRNKTNIMIRISSYLSASLFIQYTLFLLNMTANSSITPFPHIGNPSMSNYPDEYLVGNEPKYFVPIFFHLRLFRDNMMLSYMLGVGVDRQQVWSLTYDFINIFIMTMYVFEFRNPILSKKLKKVFWQFPTNDDAEQWARLDKDVQRQVDWLNNPKPLFKDGEPHPSFKNLVKELSRTQKNYSIAQHNFAKEYNRQNEKDLNYTLTTYVDLKYQSIWSEEFIKEKKAEIKKNCVYFRLVKQGSQLVYITFHIFTIFIVLLMAAMRQSLFAIVYVLILLPRMKDGAEVLKQRDIQQGKDLEDIENDIDDIKDQLKQQRVLDEIINIIKQKLGLEESSNFAKLYPSQMRQLEIFMHMNTMEIENFDREIMINKQMDFVQFEEYVSYVLDRPLDDIHNIDILMLRLVKKYRTISGDMVQELKDKLKELLKKKYKLEKNFQKKNAQLKKNDRDQLAKKQWSMINVMQRWLLLYGVIDMTCQVVFQMPLLVPAHINQLRKFGFRKLWHFNHGFGHTDKLGLDDLTYEMYVKCHPWDADGTHNQKCPHFELDWKAFYFESMNCFIVAIILLQSEIFSSAGYLKYVTQQNGSMDLLLQISELKAKSITYMYNNYKIRKILSIQRKRESTLKTVERLKEKIFRWRQFTRTTMVNQRGPSQLEDSGAIEKQSLQMQDSETLRLQKEKSETKVAFEQEDEVIEDDEEEDDEILAMHKSKEKIKISPEDREALHRKLANEFVKSKIGKQRICVRLYLWLQETFVDLIMFKNQKTELEALKTKLAGGSVHVPTELESLMAVEAQELIQNHYDNLEGEKELFKLLQLNRDKSQSILALTKFDKKIKLNQMKMTWDYTRSGPMVLHFMETFFYILISQSQNIIYSSMIFSMYENAGLISLFYPIAVFGWAILEETRPGTKFWVVVRYYTEALLAFKFLFNLDIFAWLLESDGFVQISAYFKFGIYDFDQLDKLVLYMMPELLILCFLMLHEIKLQLLGLYGRNEEDVEPVLDGIERNLLKGDEEAVKEKRIETQNMCMARYYESPVDQKQRMSEFKIIEQDQIRQEQEAKTAQEIYDNKEYSYIIRGKYTVNQCKSKLVIDQIVDHEYNEKYKNEASLLEQQDHLLDSISKSIVKTSKRFDLDSAGKKTNLDDFVHENVIQKTLESDNLTFVEGMRPKDQPNFQSRYQFKVDKAERENWENFSSGDYKQDFVAKFDSIDDRELFNPGMFDRSEYFERLFPSLKIQKPGYDLYGTTTSILGLIGVFIFMYFESYSFTQGQFEFAKGMSVVFPGEMAITVLLIITILIIERYANRSDTKKVEEKKLVEEATEHKKSFFSNEDMFKRTTTQRSMTVKLKTVKTSDLDMSSSAAQEFLSSFGDEHESEDIEQAKTKITSQQKTKFITHWFVLLFAHVYCFWFIPIKGNMQLYGYAACNEEQKEHYGCYNFKENGAIRVLYFLFVLYLIVSGFQISYGFPILKKASSVMQYYNDLGMILAQVYMLLPFICEIRCLLDFIFSKTSLDIFQFFQLFNYHWEMFIGWTGNRWYTIKVLGSPTECFDKFLFGVLIASGLLFLLIGPFYIFSSLSPFVSYNEVLQGTINLNWQINKTIGLYPEIGKVLEVKDDLNSSYERINSTMPYRFYHLDNPYLKTFDEEMWKHSKYSNSTETRFFQPNQVQYCILRRHSDKLMDLSMMAFNDLKADIREKMEHNKDLNISLQLDYSFVRAQPMDALHAFLKSNRSLNYDYFNDCNTGLELVEFADFNCGNIQDKSLSTSVIVTQAFNPGLVLGQNNWITHVQEKQKDEYDLLHDIKMTYYCDRTWDISGTLHPTIYSRAPNGPNDTETDPWGARKVNPTTCQLLDDKAALHQHSLQEIEESGMTREEFFSYKREEGNWSSIMLQLFSMTVATGFIASYTPTTFYLVLVYGLSGQVRIALIFNTWHGFTYEQTKPVAMMKLIECCYMMRHEENLVAEEECYRMLQEIIRQPQLYKELSGTCLTGTMHPDLDHLNPEQRKKLDRLDKLERKGWDVDKLKKKIISGDRKIDDLEADANNF